MTLTDEELIELGCLESVSQRASLPDGCDLTAYVSQALVHVGQPRIELTQKGQERLGILRTKKSEAFTRPVNGITP